MSQTELIVGGHHLCELTIFGGPSTCTPMAVQVASSPFVAPQATIFISWDRISIWAKLYHERYHVLLPVLIAEWTKKVRVHSRFHSPPFAFLVYPSNYTGQRERNPVVYRDRIMSTVASPNVFWVQRRMETRLLRTEFRVALVFIGLSQPPKIGTLLWQAAAYKFC